MIYISLINRLARSSGLTETVLATQAHPGQLFNHTIVNE